MPEILEQVKPISISIWGKTDCIVQIMSSRKGLKKNNCL